MPLSTAKRFRIHDVKPGMILAKTIFLDNGTVVLEEGTLLTASMIERLKNWDIFAVDILEIQHNPILSFKNHPAEPYLNFAAAYQDTVDAISFAFEDIRYFRKIPVDKLRTITSTTVTGLVESPGTLRFVHTLYQNQAYTFQHSLDVSIISGILARWMGYSGQELQDIILAGLLHDVGKTQLPRELLDKEGPLTEEEMRLMQTHPTLGYRLLSQLGTLPLSVLSCVIQHHERLNGTGYPLKLPGEQIHPHAQIIAVADMYDAMTSSRSYRPKLTPYDAVQILATDMFDQLNPSICSIFLSNLQAYLVGQHVRLSDGRNGEVIYLDGYMSRRTIIRTESGDFVDLEQSPHLTIVDMVAPNDSTTQALGGV